MNKKSWFNVVVGLLVLSGCRAAPIKAPTQVVYRFDDHRYLELKGFNCQGGLTYVDTQRNIRHQIYDISDGYRIFTKKFIHPSTRYIVVPEFNNAGSFFISKDYGQTWVGARMAPGGGADRYGERIPARTYNGIKYAAGEFTHPVWDDVVSLTVINDQGFLMNRWGDLYMSSKPFDDPRLLPGGEGIPYTYMFKGKTISDRLMHGSSGLDWGREYISWNAVDGPEHWDIGAYDPKWQNIPNKVPEVKNYTGWDRMRCNPDLGLESAE